jgi:hypothetical protein
MGAEKLLSELEAELVDGVAGYQLYKIDSVFSQTAYFLKYSCPSTGRVYVSGIDPDIGSRNNAIAACAWKWGIEKEDWKTVKET